MAALESRRLAEVSGNDPTFARPAPRDRGRRSDGAAYVPMTACRMCINQLGRRRVATIALAV